MTLRMSLQALLILYKQLNECKCMLNIDPIPTKKTNKRAFATKFRLEKTQLKKTLTRGLLGIKLYKAVHRQFKHATKRV